MTREKGRSGAASRVLLALLVYGLISSALWTVLPNRALYFLLPHMNLFILFSNWFDPRLLFVPLHGVQLLCWLIMLRGLRFGRWPVLYLNAACIILEATVLVFHMATMFKLYAYGAFGVEALRALYDAVFYACIIAFQLKWYPSHNIR